MPLATVREPFTDHDWIFEASARSRTSMAITANSCRVAATCSSLGPYLCEELAYAVRCTSAVLDGEIACLRPDGRSHFYNLMFRREWPYFMAFDLMSLDGADLRERPLQERKRLLSRIMPCVESNVRYVEGIRGLGIKFFCVACAHDLEGIVATWKSGTYQPGPRASWVKIRNPHYSQWEGRRDLFDARSNNATRRRQPMKPKVAII